MLPQTDSGSWRVAPGVAGEAWQGAFARWLERTPTRKARKRSDLTLDAYLRDVRLFGAYFEQVNGTAFEPGLLNTTDLRAYFGQMEAEGKPATHNRKLASLRMLIAWAREEGLLEYDPSAWIPAMDATRESPRDVAGEEWERLEAAANALVGPMGLRDRLIFGLMGYGGLRISEVVGLKLSDLHLDDRYIHVLGKGQKHRKVRVAGRLAQIIEDWLEVMPDSVEGMLVTDLNGQAIDRVTAWRRFGLIAATAGVKTTPHAMRHTFIYRFLDRYEAHGLKWQAALKAVCQQTGDTPDVILAYYSGARESDIYAVMEEM